MRKAIFLILLIFWILLSGISVTINTEKAFKTEKNWLFLSDSEKRYMLFGNFYVFLTFIDSNTPLHANILVYSKDIRTFYLGNYYLYPRLMQSTNSTIEFNKLVNSKKYIYIAVYDNELQSKLYKQIGSFTSLDKHDFGKLYKRL